ncbi:dihydrofolate reductase family protein [Sphingomonas sp.]|uniref:dihydrofolate reductase family protein n=1 Tax=Sphingomonas sp. TaxID=28214 RepID=UPI003AFFCC24
MRKVIGSVFLTLDGVMQAPGGPTEDPTGGFGHGGWLGGIFDEEAGAAIGAFFDRPYDLLLGRRTYDIFAAYWPYQTGDNAIMGDAFTAAGKHVLTRGGQDLPWANSHRLSGMDDVAALKATDGPDLLIQGSSTLYPALLAAGLLDRLTLMSFPLVLGQGKRLFGDGTPAASLRLVEHQVTSGGAVIATYEPNGPAPSGEIGPPATSDREAARQQAMREGRW